MQRTYLCIDLKTFYASVECVERHLNPFNTNLVVADSSRGKGAICLAITPKMKMLGIKNRCRIFEIPDNITYITALPRMKLYIDYSSRIYNVYLKYIAPDDIYVYSIDEVFIDITDYLKIYKLSPNELITKMIQDVYQTTGITATGGIGTNMYLSKVAMDIVAKHVEGDENGVRIGSLNEESYKRLLWNHRPLTDFWRVGKGYAKKLERYRMYTMGDVARCSINNEDLLYKLFGVNAELLIDHAWGVEPVTMKDIKNYKPSINSMSSGQVLHCPYGYEKTKLIVKEMTDLLVLDLVDKNKVCDQIVLTIGYDIDNLTDPKISEIYDGEVTVDYYGRVVPKHAHGSINFDCQTSSTEIIMKGVLDLFERIIDKRLLVRRINLVFSRLVDKDKATNTKVLKQLDLFSEESNVENAIDFEEEEKIQSTILNIKKKYGKNAILKGMNLEDGGTTIERNNQIGGHRA